MPKSKLIVSAVLLMAFAPAQATYIKSWVSDHLEVPLRQSPLPQAKSTKSLMTGQAVFLLQKSADQEWSLIELEGGERGWLPSKALTQEPVASALLAVAQQKLAASSEDNRRMKEENASLRQEKEALDSQKQQLSAELEQVRNELNNVNQASTQALQIQSERNQLRTALNSQQSAMDQVNEENQRLRQDERRQWFMIGAGVLLGGILLGLLLPRLKTRRRSSWGSSSL